MGCPAGHTPVLGNTASGVSLLKRMLLSGMALPIGAALISAFCGILMGCGKKVGDAGTAKVQKISPGYDGFYVEMKYFEGLQKNLSIFSTPFPNGTLYLQIHGDSVVMDYANHEGGSGALQIDSGNGPLQSPGDGTMGGGPVVVRRVEDSVLEAWEKGADVPSRFRRMAAGIRTVEDVYASLLLDGSYRCEDERFCGDTVQIRGGAVTGMNGKSGMRIVIDWMDNMPQMDYLELYGKDSTHMAYVVSRDRLELFAIDLPGECRSINEYDCPLTEAIRGKRHLELTRLNGARRAESL